MTFRSVALGVVLALVLCVLSVLLRTDLMGPGFMPAAVFGVVILAALVYNPLGRRIGWQLSGKELAVIALLMLAGGSAPGLMGGMADMSMLPHAVAPMRADWKKQRVLEQLPPAMLADTARQGRHDPLQDYIDGKGEAGNGFIALSDVPWYAWQRPLAFYLPLIVAVAAACLGMALLVHPQWSAHERLSYPIATFVSLLIGGEGGRRGIMSRWSFWVAAGAVILLNLFNYADTWFHWGSISLELPFTPVFELSETYMAGNAAPALSSPRILFLVVGLAYLLSSDLSLSMGIGPYLFTFLVGWLQVMGVQIQGGVMEPDRTQFLYAGAWAGTVIVLLYLGRRFYWDALRSALFLPVSRPVPGYAVWGLRLLIVATAAGVVILSGIGINWLLGLAFLVALLAIALVFTRLVSETGVYLIQAYVFPGITLLGFFGLAAMGQENYLVLSILGASALGSQFIVLMSQGLRLAETRGVSAAGSGAAAGATVVLCLALAVPLFFVRQYDRGLGGAESGGFAHVQWPINGAIKVQQDIKFNFNRTWNNPEGLGEMLARIQPHRDLLAAFGITAALVILFSAARIRFAWWPLHPAMFLVFITFYAQWLAGSFLLGWAIKTGVTRFGGAKSYENFKPAMMGLVAGEVLATMVIMIITNVTR